jgi:hypothetical protein
LKTKEAEEKKYGCWQWINPQSNHVPLGGQLANHNEPFPKCQDYYLLTPFHLLENGEFISLYFPYSFVVK